MSAFLIKFNKFVATKCNFDKKVWDETKNREETKKMEKQWKYCVRELKLTELNRFYGKIEETMESGGETENCELLKSEDALINGFLKKMLEKLPEKSIVLSLINKVF